MASIAFGVVVSIQYEIGGMVKRRRTPPLGVMAFNTIIFNCAVKRIIWVIVATSAILPIHACYHGMVEWPSQFPFIGSMAFITGCRQLLMQFVCWFLMAFNAIVYHRFCNQCMFKIG